MRGEALRGDTISTLDFKFNIATAFEIIHGNAGKAWKGKALGSRIPLQCCMLGTNIGKRHLIAVCEMYIIRNCNCTYNHKQIYIEKTDAFVIDTHQHSVTATTVRH